MRPCLECGQALVPGPKVKRTWMARPTCTLLNLDSWRCACGGTEVEIPHIADLEAAMDAYPGQTEWTFMDGRWT